MLRGGCALQHGDEGFPPLLLLRLGLRLDPAQAALDQIRIADGRLQIDLPEIGLFVSTRKQSLDVPFDGAAVELQPLNEAQQMQIARILRGQEGLRIVDEAWRTPGVRELVTIPLYLTALLSLPDSQPIPKTKEEILRRFVRRTNSKLIAPSN